MVLLTWPQHLRIASEYGTPGNEYRICHGDVEFRTLNQIGVCQDESDWKAVSPEDISMHFALNTPVAEWLGEAWQLDNAQGF
jgi:hypothetical protein